MSWRVYLEHVQQALAELQRRQEVRQMADFLMGFSGLGSRRKR